MTSNVYDRPVDAVPEIANVNEKPTRVSYRRELSGPVCTAHPRVKWMRRPAAHRCARAPQPWTFIAAPGGSVVGCWLFREARVNTVEALSPEPRGVLVVGVDTENRTLDLSLACCLVSHHLSGVRWPGAPWAVFVRVGRRLGCESS
jgi:hypothetical protein